MIDKFLDRLRLEMLHPGHGKRQNDERKGPDVIRAADIIGLTGMRSQMEKFLTLSPQQPYANNRELSQALQRAFGVWWEMQTLQEKNDQAKLVLFAYYQNGKIRYYLRGLEEFTEEMDTIEDDRILRRMPYSNFVFFLRPLVEELKAKYEKPLHVEVQGSPVYTPKNVAWFIQAECGHVAAIQDLPKAWREAVKVLSSARDGQEKTNEFKRAVANASSALELLGQCTEKDLQQVRDVANSCESRKQAMEKNIREGTELYEWIASSLTEEWFCSFDPEDEASPVRDMPRTGLEEFYKEKIKEAGIPEMLEERGRG